MQVPMIVRPSVELEMYQFMLGLQGDLSRGAITFEDAARQYSQSGEGAQGGLLGWTRRGTYQFDAAAFDLKPGTVSKVVRSFMGFHILRVTDTRSAELNSPERARRAIEDKLRRERFIREMEKWYEVLRANSVVRVPPFEPLFDVPPPSS